MKTIIITCLLTLFLGYCHAANPDAPYRLFGEISTVENKTYRGFITWGGQKNYWIDFFEAVKPENPYAPLFDGSDGVFFYQNGQQFVKPPVHIFCCRFGNIKSIRPTGDREVMLQLKNGEEFPLVKGSMPDINTTITITTGTERVAVKWDHISEIHFMPADSNSKAPELSTVAGIVKSPQGVYKGLIYWNGNRRQSPERINSANDFLNRLEKVTLLKGAKNHRPFTIMAYEKNTQGAFMTNPGVLLPADRVMVNMPNIGSVSVPMSQLNELTIIPVAELKLLSYDDFSMPQHLKGEVTTRSDIQVSGTMAYDLDENLDIEVLDGRNNNITYRIPFKYIATIEPKNYKYSFITLKNGSQLSLGEAPDVNRENSGIIVFGENHTPTYIFWNEVKSVKINKP